MSESKKRGKPKSKESIEQITINLSPMILKELKELSWKSYNPISFHIRQAIAEYLKKE